MDFWWWPYTEVESRRVRTIIWSESELVLFPSSQIQETDFSCGRQKYVEDLQLYGVFSPIQEVFGFSREEVKLLLYKRRRTNQGGVR
ncbi:hypothetical protein C5167_006056 [Papaver somniferum]|uniref:Uncharacterized protein n=1 Tax=Papaver somniferum TaxID=3469 RepID=A0A4Y7JCC9_PAPSO|nr:hypothetical protein C5167_006056 [Papaver somniferum]